MKKKTPFLDFYKERMRSGKLLNPGLCNSVDDETDTLILFYPTTQDANMFAKELGYYVTDFKYVFWGSGLHIQSSLDRKSYDFTPLRQTIVLFCAAINGEL